MGLFYRELRKGIIMSRPNKVAVLCLEHDYADASRGFSYEYYNIFLSLLESGLCESVIHVPLELAMRDSSSAIDLLKRCDTIIYFPFINQWDQFIFSNILGGLDFDSSSSLLNRIIEWDADSSWRYRDDIAWKVGHELTSRSLPIIDYFVTTHSQAVAWYRADGATVFKSQWGAYCTGDAIVAADSGTERVRDVSFIGHPHSNRRGFIRELRERGINIDVFGHGWNDNSFVTYEKMWKIMSESKICLNLSNASVGGLEQIKGRHFEIPMSGALQLSSPADNLGDYYTTREIVLFESVEECANSIDHLLYNDDERIYIAQNAQDVCMTNHSWILRFDDLFNEIVAHEKG